MIRTHLKLGALAASMALAMASTANAQIVINEFWNGSGTDEWVEFYNTTAAPVDVSGWQFARRTNAGTSDAILYTFPAATTIPAGGYYVIADSGSDASVLAIADDSFGNAISTGAQGLGLLDGSSNIIDSIGITTSPPGGVGVVHYTETAPFTLAPTTGTGIKRSPNGTDTNDNSADFVRYSGFINATPGIDNDTPPPGAVQVADIAAARAEAINTEVEILGTVIVTAGTGFNVASRNQFVVQDASGADGQTAIFIDDPTNVAGTAVVPGDTITGLTGTLGNFQGLLQIVPTEPIVVGAPAAVPAPLVLTNAVTDLEDVESELVVINSVDIAETGDWTVGTSYTFTDPTDLVTTVLRLGSDNPIPAAAPPLNEIPVGAFSLTGIVLDSNGTGQVQPRDTDDIGPLSSVSDWTLY